MGPPVLFGHYWLTGVPSVLSTNAACVDYSVGKGGPIVAYRWQHQASIALAKDVGCTVVTFNSLALGRTQDEKDATTGVTSKVAANTLMVVAPVANQYTAAVEAVSNSLYGTQGPKTDAVTVRMGTLLAP